MKIAYFDCFAGASGDMILGALVDAGLSLDHLRTELAKLKLSGYDLQSRRVVKNGLGGTQVLVLVGGRCEAPGQHHHHHHHPHPESAGHHHHHAPGEPHHHHHHHHHPHEAEGHHHHHFQVPGHWEPLYPRSTAAAPVGHHQHEPHHHTPEEHLHPEPAEAGHQGHRNLAVIQELIRGSELSPTIKDKSLAIFARLAAAEAKVHRTGIEEIHFHEVGATDAIIDIVGTVIGLEALGIDRIYCSPLQVGGGTVQCAHGVLPVPAPATLELVRGKPIYATGIQGELLTPTGAAILTTLASGFGSLPAMTVEAVGYGAGSLDLTLPNLLRVTIGREPLAARGLLTETVAVLETNIDDMNPQIYEHLIQQLLELGAVEVFLTPIQMKKNRPGVLFTVICPPELVETCTAFLWRETTTIGLRWRLEHRHKLARESRLAATKFGPLRFKFSYLEGRPVQVTPEYEDCKRLALEQGVPLLQVMEEARAVALTLAQAEAA